MASKEQTVSLAVNVEDSFRLGMDFYLTVGKSKAMSMIEENIDNLSIEINQLTQELEEL